MYGSEKRGSIPCKGNVHLSSQYAYRLCVSFSHQSVPGVKWGLKLDNHLHLTQELGICGAITPPHSDALSIIKRKNNSPFTFHCNFTRLWASRFASCALKHYATETSYALLEWWNCMTLWPNLLTGGATCDSVQTLRNSTQTWIGRDMCLGTRLSAPLSN
jgi:hypothetical protein